MTCLGIPYIWWNPPIPNRIAYAINYDTIALSIHEYHGCLMTPEVFL